MNVLLAYARADQTLLRGHQQLIDLCELRRAQPIKRIVKLDLKRKTSWTSLSHAFVARSETPSVHA
jgi:hypothetical protein